MTPETIWYEDTYVRSSETDFSSRWKLSSLVAAMVEAAGHHASHLGVGYQEMIAQDIAWVLSRLKIRFFEFPRLGDPVKIQTWPKTIQQKIFFMRDYHVLAADGHKLASATSAYVLVNPRARRMVPPQVLQQSLPDNRGLSALDESLEKIPPVENVEDMFRVQAGYSTVDLLGHVNNTRYIDWISNCFDFAHHETYRPAWLQINFINEIRPEDTVLIQKGAYNGSHTEWYLAGRNLTTGAKAFESQIGWEKRA